MSQLHIQSGGAHQPLAFTIWSMKPSVGRIVHYVSRGSADGIFQPECRAAIITDISEDNGRVALCVLNPQGIFFDWDLKYDDENVATRSTYKPGTWHWPERVEE